MKTIEINGIEFESINPNTKQGESIVYNSCHPWKKYEGITEAYNRPSIRKINIWEYWKRWYNETDIISGEIWICSRNHNCFSITFTGFWNGHKIYGYITKTYNKVVII